MPIVHIRGCDDSERSKWLPWWEHLHSEGAGAGKAGPAEPFAAEKDGEPVFIKHTYDVFLSGDTSASLLAHLASQNITRLFICGVLTKACVGFSANSAFTLGFEVYIVEDCCADRSRAHHDAYISLYDGYHIRVCRHDAVISFETDTIPERQE